MLQQQLVQKLLKSASWILLIRCSIPTLLLDGCNVAFRGRIEAWVTRHWKLKAPASNNSCWRRVKLHFSAKQKGHWEGGGAAASARTCLSGAETIVFSPVLHNWWKWQRALWHWARNERGSPQFLTHLQPALLCIVHLHFPSLFALAFPYLFAFALPYLFALAFPCLFALALPCLFALALPHLFVLAFALPYLFVLALPYLFALAFPCLFALGFPCLFTRPQNADAAVWYREHLIGWTKYRFDQRRGELRHLRESRINIAGSCQTKPSKAAGIKRGENMSLLQKHFWILTDDFSWISPTGVVFQDSFTGCPRYNSTCEAQWPSAQNDSLYRESRLTLWRRDGR